MADPFDVLVSNPPWPGEGYGVRSNSRWPHRRGDKILAYPIYLAYTAAVLEESGFRVHGIDAVQKELSIEGFAAEVKRINPGLVVLETSTPSIEHDLRTARAVKEACNATVLLVGPHASIYHQDILEENPAVDMIARGEFDYTVRDVTRALAGGEGLEGVLGISYRQDGGVKVNPDRPLIEDLDGLPYPARHIFLPQDYSQGWYAERTAMMISSRGCPSHCTYCLWPQVMYGHKFRYRSPKGVVDEMEYLAKEHGITSIDFDDDTFTMNKRRVQEICREILRRGLKVKWRCFARVNTVDRETLALMKEAGAYYIHYGVESGDPEILERTKKNITLEGARNAIAWSKELGIKTHATFMFGLPGETSETIAKTIGLAKELDADTTQFSIAMPYPGTELFEEMKEKGYLRYKSWAEFDGCHGPVIETERFTKKDLERIVSRAYREYYLRPGMVLKKLRTIRSLGDLKLLVKGVRTVLTRILFY